MKKNTIFFKLSLIIIITVFIIQGTFGILSYYNYSNQVEKDFKNEIIMTNKRLSLILPAIVWNFQIKVAQEIIETEVLNDIVDAITIKDIDGTVIASFPNNTIKKHIDNEHTKTINLMYSGEKIATVIIDYNHHTIDKTKQYLIKTILVKGILILILLPLLMGFLINKYIVSNIIRLQKDISLFSKDNNYISHIKINTNDEIGFLFKEFESMKHNLKKSWLKLNQINENLEDKVKEEVTKNKEIQEQLYRSEKLASMGEMIGNIAHQWRQPLSVISTSATGLAMQKEFGTLDDETLYRYCDDINKNAQYLSQTIDDFKNFIKGDRNKKIFNVQNMLNAFLNLISGPIKTNNIKVVLDCDKDINIESYENELIQCLINMFNNAKDALIEKEEKNKLIIISSYTKNNKVYINLKDNAKGIPDAIISKVFDPYFTTKHQSQGTGLGLNMTYRLITEGMNGDLIVKNEEFIYNDTTYFGASFTIALPYI